MLGRYILVNPKPSAMDNFGQEVMNQAMEDVAKELKGRLRSRLDTGVDLNAALRASNLKVEYTPGRIIIHEGGSEDEKKETKSSDLFQSNMEPPTVDGNKLIFKQIRDHEIQRKNTQAVISSMEEVMALKFPNSFAQSVKRVEADHPELGK